MGGRARRQGSVSLASSSQVLQSLSEGDRKGLLDEKVLVTRHLERGRTELHSVESHFLRRGEDEDF